MEGKENLVMDKQKLKRKKQKPLLRKKEQVESAFPLCPLRSHINLGPGPQKWHGLGVHLENLHGTESKNII